MPLENLEEIVLVPAHRWPQARQLPLPVNLLVVVPDQGMSVTFGFDLFLIRTGIPLMCRSKLVIAINLGVGNPLKFGSADEVLSVNKWVSNESGIGHHADELFAGHGIPGLSGDFGVVDLGVGLYKALDDFG
jgi:hypothetical protein